MEINDKMKMVNVNLSLDGPISPNAHRNPFKTTISKKLSDSQMYNGQLKAKMIRNQNNSLRVG